MAGHRRMAAWGMIGLVLALGWLATVAQAQEDPSGWGDAHASYGRQTMHKLGRGIANVFTGIFEIPRTAQIVTTREGSLAGSTIGLTQGIWRMLLREVVGVYEVLTFYAEVPPDFKPMMRPEFIFAYTNWADTEGAAP